jgi:hypothetical protein
MVDHLKLSRAADGVWRTMSERADVIEGGNCTNLEDDRDNEQKNKQQI